MKPLRVKFSGNVLFWVGIYFVFNLTLAFNFLFVSGEIELGLLCYFVAMLLFIPAARVGQLEMTDEYIRLKLLMGCFEIGWDEIERIERSPQDTFLVFHGTNKKLVIQGRELWLGADKTAMLELFKRRADELGLKVSVTPKANWQISRSTRVKEF